MTVASTKHALLTALLLTSAAFAQDSKRVVLVQPSGKTAGQWTLEVVSDTADPITLDAYSQAAIEGSPSLEVIGPNSAYLHFYSDYGMYQGSIKYVFDPAGSKPPVKTRYAKMPLTSVAREHGKLYYSASFDHEQHATIIVDPRANGALPAYQIVEGGELPQPVAPPNIRGPGGELVTVQNTTPPGQIHRASVVFVGAGANQQAYPVPIPTLDFHRRAVPQKQPPGEIENDIGPYVQGSEKIWFANTFYDSEGVSGVGAIGTFDLATRQYEMRYLPEIAPWSGSAILLDGDDLWIGLMRRPEGADIAAGLLRYNIPSGAVESIAIPDIIFTVDRAGDALYCGTSHGLYIVRGSQITQLRFEPDATGKLVMIPHSIRPSAK